MKSMLHIDSSAHAENSVSRQLSAEVVNHWLAKYPDYHVVRRELGIEPIPHLDATLTGAYFTPAEQHNAAQQAAIARSDELVDELKQADVIVIGVPMYNFGIPSTLKAWIDHVARAGQTFRYTENGPQGLLEGKKVIIVTARGGQYTGSPLDHQEPYLKTIMNFMGIEDVTYVRAEGLAMGGDEERACSIEDARQRIRQLIAA